MSTEILEMHNINKSFSKVKVLKDVNFSLKTGEIHALVGSNGAGKSTLMKILTGVYDFDSGDIQIDNQKVDNLRVDAKKYGISMIFQELSLIPTMTVAENIFLGNEINKGHQLNKKEMKSKTREILNTLGLDIDPDIEVSNLSTGMSQMVEIAKAISKDSKILVFDEPTTALSDKESAQLFGLIRELKARDITIVYISHRMKEILDIADRITILRDGKKVLTEEIRNITMKEIVKAMISESSTSDSFAWKKRDYDPNGKDILKVENLKINDKIDNISFSIKEGEIVGIAGLMGSGRTEILESLFGIRNVINGDIFIESKRVVVNNVNDAIKAGFALVPENRRTQGLVLQHSIKDNIVLPILDNVSKTFNFLDDSELNDLAIGSSERLAVKYNSIFSPINLLSGGNQQKVVISKWLNTSPKILLLDEPTSGVDIGAKSEITDIIRKIADEGNGVLLVSSEIAELLAVCDKIIILYDGKITNTFTREEIMSEEELQYAIQAK